jgi:subtilisin family serine protease
MNRSFMLRSFCFTIALALVFALASISSRTTHALAFKTVIVELSREPVVVAKYRANLEGQAFDANAYRQQVIADQDSFLQRAAAAGVSYTIAGVSAPNGSVTADIKFRFNYVYNGVTLVVPDAAIPLLKNIQGVKGVYEAEEVHPDLDRSVDYIRAPQLYGNPPKLTQFDQLNTGGLHGEGMIVCVIDTGIDWTHPMFGGDPTPPQFGVGPAVAAAGTNKKVLYYLNLTAGVTLDDFGHGTHVSADIAGYQAVAPTYGDDGTPYTGPSTTIHGVAPQARLMVYKTLTGVGAGLNPSTIMAVEDAVQPFTLSGYPKPVPHVINLSLGTAPPGGNNPDHPTAVACDNATLAGVTIVASAGNSGRPAAVTPDGEATIGSPGAGRRVITVGANNDPGSLIRNTIKDRVFVSGNPPDTSDVMDPAGINRNQTGLVDAGNKPTATGQRTDIVLGDVGGSPYLTSAVGQYYVFAGTVQTPADVPDSVSGRIAIARPSGAFAAVITALAAKGAAGVLLIQPTAASLTGVQTTVPARSIGQVDADYLLDLLSSTDNDTGDPAKGGLSEFPIRLKAGTFQPAMADFSSRGPVTGFGQIKPDITGPGVNIISATVRAGAVATSGSTMFDPTGYISASGTSFSSPITAGAVTLIKQKHMNWTPAMIRAALINTATNLRHADGTPRPDGANTLNEQGGGLIDAFAAVNATALMGTGAPGPSGSAPATRPFSIGVAPLVGTSPGNPDFSASYSFGNVAVAGVIGTSTHSQTVNIYDVASGAGAGTYRLAASSVRFVNGTTLRVSFTDGTGNDLSEVVVPANGSATFKVNLVVNGEELSDASQVQWYVTATRTDGGQRLRMPFYFRAILPAVTTGAPNLSAVNGNELADNPPVDIDGNYQLQYSAPAGGTQPSKYRVQESTDNGSTWTTLADVNASQTTFDIAGRANGNYLYRVIGLVPVENGLFPSAPSASKPVMVDHRTEADVTAMINAAIVDGSLSFGTTTQFDQVLKNISNGTTIYPPLRFTIISIQSSSGMVRVANAENGGDGVSSPALYDYTNAAGFDITPGESSGSKHLAFSNPRVEMFTFTAVVRGNLRDATGGASAAGSTSGGDSTSSGTSGGTSSTGSGLPASVPLQGKVLSFTVNPLTRTVSVRLL